MKDIPFIVGLLAVLHLSNMAVLGAELGYTAEGTQNPMGRAAFWTTSFVMMVITTALDYYFAVHSRYELPGSAERKWELLLMAMNLLLCTIMLAIYGTEAVYGEQQRARSLAAWSVSTVLALSMIIVLVRPGREDFKKVIPADFDGIFMWVQLFLLLLSFYSMVASWAEVDLNDEVEAEKRTAKLWAASLAFVAAVAMTGRLVYTGYSQKGKALVKRSYW